MSVKQMTTSEFIKKARNKHGNTYDYSSCVYTGSHRRLSIVCQAHGKFEQFATTHLNGRGCPKCKFEKLKEINTKTTSQFIKEAAAIHDNRYNYSKTKYVGASTKVEIVCVVHGPFFQTPSMHIAGQGCPNCGHENSNRSKMLTTHEFKSMAALKHGKLYDYSNTVYIDCYTPVEIICSKHGSFQQAPYRHLYGGGCSKCAHIISKPENKWLDFLHVPKTYRQKTIVINGQKIIVDAYDPTTNTVYEFYGDYWHGNNRNPRFPPESINKRNKRNKMTFKKLYELTCKRENLIKCAGFNLITIWEMDWKLAS